MKKKRTNATETKKGKNAAEMKKGKKLQTSMITKMNQKELNS